MAVMSSFGQAAVYRMKFTFEALKQKYKDSVVRFQQLFNAEGSSKNYREAIKKVSPPAIPFLFVFRFSSLVTDITKGSVFNRSYIC